MNTRKFSSWEMQLIVQLLDQVPAEKERLLGQLERATAHVQNPDGTIIEIQYPGRALDLGGQHPIAEAEVMDANDKRIEILLFADSQGDLLELELCKYEDDPIAFPIKLGSLRAIAR